jgi:hypothetical protein
VRVLFQSDNDKSEIETIEMVSLSDSEKTTAPFTGYDKLVSIPTGIKRLFSASAKWSNGRIFFIEIIVVPFAPSTMALSPP